MTRLSLIASSLIVLALTGCAHVAAPPPPTAMVEVAGLPPLPAPAPPPSPETRRRQNRKTLIVGGVLASVAGAAATLAGVLLLNESVGNHDGDEIGNGNRRQRRPRPGRAHLRRRHGDARRRPLAPRVARRRGRATAARRPPDVRTPASCQRARAAR
jgi:hypothetical protein